MDSEMVPAEVPPEPMDCDEALEPRLGLVDLLSGPEGSELASLCGLLLRLEELSEVVGVALSPMTGPVAHHGVGRRAEGLESHVLRLGFPAMVELWLTGVA